MVKSNLTMKNEKTKPCKVAAFKKLGDFYKALFFAH